MPPFSLLHSLPLLGVSFYTRGRLNSTLWSDELFAPRNVPKRELYRGYLELGSVHVGTL